jgi:hypothetical protein
MSKTSPHKTTIIARRARAIGLRKRGLTLESIASLIATEFGIPTYCRQRAFDDVRESIAQLNQEASVDADEHRQMELSRLDHYLTRLAPAIETGEAKAIEAALKISRARCSMLGLDAGVRIIVEKELTVEIELVLSKLETALDAPTYQMVLYVISGREMSS